MIDEDAVGEAARQLRTVLAEIAEDDLSCSAGARNRIEGAALALESLAGQPGGPPPK